MRNPFLPSGTEQLTEATSIALVEKLERQPILTPLSDQAIATTFVRQGSGHPPILLLHGFDSSVLEFRRLLPLLAPHHETWAVDFLGFGFTERRLDLSLSPQTIKTHLYSVWKTLIQQPVILVGASMGGAAAIDFTLTYPEAVSKLVLLDSAGFTAGPALGKFLITPLGAIATGFLRNPKVRQSISEKAYHDPQWANTDALQCTTLHLQDPHWAQALIAFTQSGGYGSFQRQLAQIQQPTLILWGDRDRILGTQDAPKFQQAIPHSQLVWIKDCGHVPHLEKPQETAAQILAFIQELQSDPSTNTSEIKMEVGF